MMPVFVKDGQSPDVSSTYFHTKRKSYFEVTFLGIDKRIFSFESVTLVMKIVLQL